MASGGSWRMTSQDGSWPGSSFVRSSLFGCCHDPSLTVRTATLAGRASARPWRDEGTSASCIASDGLCQHVLSRFDYALCQLLPQTHHIVWFVLRQTTQHCHLRAQHVAFAGRCDYE